MAYLDTHSSILSNISPDKLELIKLFNKANQLPKGLITQNSLLMQAAFTKVPQDVWMERLIDLQIALKTKKSTEANRRLLVTARKSDMLPHVDQLLDQAFLQKYEELIEKVRYDFNGFFPYKVSLMNQQLLVFEKLEYSELLTYIFSHL